MRRASGHYKAVFFDAGGTLFRVYPSVGKIYSRVAAKYGMRVGHARVEAAFHREFERLNRSHTYGMHASPGREKLWWRTIVWNVFSKLVVVKEFDRFFDELYRLFARPEVWRLYPEVRPVLRALRRRGCVLGIVSNWDSRLIALTRKLGLSREFDFVLASALVGSAKPDAGIFKEALRRARVRPEESIHVGDRFHDDYLGAGRVGIRPLLVHRNGAPHKRAETISSLRGVLPLLDAKN